MIAIDTPSMRFIMGEDINNNYNQQILISVVKRNRGQGMIEIIPTGSGSHYIYLWYDEGMFPSEFDLVADSLDPSMPNRMRLRVIGVDEI